jgi:hypothetical protein
MSSAPKPAPPVDMLLLVSLYAAECFLLIVALAIHRMGDRSLASSLGSTTGIGFVVALLAFLAAAAIIAHRYRLSRRLDSHSFVFTAAMNLITVALIFIPVEIAVRLLSRSASDTAIFLNTILAPRNWEKAAAINREIFDKASGHLSYPVYDETLGWTVGRDRRGANGLYLSSAEGLRAARRGAVLAGPKTKRRIAIVGDSFVFADEWRSRTPGDTSWKRTPEASSRFSTSGYADTRSTRHSSGSKRTCWHGNPMSSSWDFRSQTSTGPSPFIRSSARRIGAYRFRSHAS